MMIAPRVKRILNKLVDVVVKLEQKTCLPDPFVPGYMTVSKLVSLANTFLWQKILSEKFLKTHFVGVYICFYFPFFYFPIHFLLFFLFSLSNLHNKTADFLI